MHSSSSPFPHCRNIFAVGRNYAAHASELQNPIPERPLLFEKAVASLVTGEQVSLPRALFPIHHEIEVVLEIGSVKTPGTLADLSCIRSIGLGIDFTARDMQSDLKKQGHPWLRAKSFHNSAYLTSLVPFNSPWQDLAFQLYRNDQCVQDGHTSKMLFPPLELLQELNQTLKLSPGDLIYTGTPAGVGPVAEGDLLSLVCQTLNIRQCARVTAF